MPCHPVRNENHNKSRHSKALGDTARQLQKQIRDFDFQEALETVREAKRGNAHDPV